MEEPPFINLAPPDPVSGRCNVDRGVPCKVVRKPTVAITAETENPEWVSNFFHKKHTTHRSVLPTIKIQSRQFYEVHSTSNYCILCCCFFYCDKFQVLAKILSKVGNTGTDCYWVNWQFWVTKMIIHSSCYEVGIQIVTNLDTGWTFQKSYSNSYSTIFFRKATI